MLLELHESISYRDVNKVKNFHIRSRITNKENEWNTNFLTHNDSQSDLDMTSVVLQNILLNLDSEHIQRRQLSLEQSDFIFRL